MWQLVGLERVQRSQRKVSMPVFLDLSTISHMQLHVHTLSCKTAAKNMTFPFLCFWTEKKEKSNERTTKGYNTLLSAEKKR
jgi:hypothetical protein